MSQVPFLPATSCGPSPVPAADLRLAVVVGPPWFIRAAGDFANDASELPGSKTGDVVPAVRYSSCVWVIGEVASTIRNNLIADLLLLSKCHAPAQSLLGLGPRPRTFAPALCLLKPRRPQVQARKRGRVPYSHGLWSLAALHGVKGRRRYSGGGWAHLWRGF